MDSLQNHFLIAMPSLNDTFFERSLIYICEHDAKGAMGLMVNRPIGLEVQELLAQLDLKEAPQIIPSLENQVLIGGPVNPERGFVLHSNQPHWANSNQVSDELMLTTSRDILAALGTAKAPIHFLVVLGYAGWSRNQLEQELAENSWLTIPATKALLFDTPFEERWEKATHSLGFDAWQMSGDIGHA
ncbi:MAG: putative transcriptional regulator [Shewanella sp.]|jgi:putative transcriptional regulator|uniref:YqgE/AlgH family protein n=1 Tax=Shewanella sp. 4t3-1-2LB TaxID=2817682 RepID=UPI001A997738|nr:YqgE/AlgH family protein [Shewanella sp. 4t3-1-2LB]MBO1271926.1 YqgE/AlgH family protein [Shewanella sp. 4t3-1-2LB]MDN5368728.1 putative transcriptional regulator [Shewanella sp.]